MFDAARTWAVVRREFAAFVRTRAYVLGTLFGPLMIALVILLPIWLLSGGGGTRAVAIIDETGTDLGGRVAAALTARAGFEGAAGGETAVYRVQVETVAGPDRSLEDRLRRQIAADSLDGILWLPAGLLAGRKARYEGENATSFREMGELKEAVQRTVQGARLEAAGIDAAAVREAFRRVEMEVRKTDERGVAGTPEGLLVLAQFMGFVIYFMVIFYGIAAARGVQEEKRDRIVEILMSSVPPEGLMAGKVVGIVAAGLLQVSIWAGFAALVLTAGEGVVERLGGYVLNLPDVPPGAALVFLVFLAGGFFLYSCIYAAIGAIATSDQEVQQLQFPVLIPLVVGFFLTFAVLQDPDGGAAVAGSLFPLTSPLVMPIRATIVPVPPLQMAAAVALLIGSSVVLLWLGGRIYRVSILATGKRPTMGELWRWLRASM
ncbi:MAG TPA: ABC transporter permease [Gemmatimonadota bacterium]|nr:ABC transporter permease [Gemmatimonadota bacterium]